jgi:hypothetical protein
MEDSTLRAALEQAEKDRESLRTECRDLMQDRDGWRARAGAAENTALCATRSTQKALDGKDAMIKALTRDVEALRSSWDKMRQEWEQADRLARERGVKLAAIAGAKRARDARYRLAHPRREGGAS